MIGGGISGITAAIEASEAGCDVVLVEKKPYLGGRVAQMHQYFPKLCPPTCGLEINLRRIRTSPRIRCLTLAEVEKIERRGRGTTARPSGGSRGASTTSARPAARAWTRARSSGPTSSTAA